MVVSDNTQYGGAWIDSGTLMVKDSTFARNRSEGGGGAIFNLGGEATVLRSTFVDNTTSEGGADNGGGASHNDGVFKIVNSTFVGNTAAPEDPISGRGAGGAIGNHRSGRMTVESSTISGNRAPDGTGGGIHTSPAPGSSFTIRDSIVADNEAPEAPDVFGGFTSGGYNLVGDPNGSTGFGPTDQQNVPSGLDPEGLKDNGGPTQTVAPLPESPAVDAIEVGCPPPETDQRGVSRPQDGDGDGTSLCDIGAYERDVTS